MGDGIEDNYADLRSPAHCQSIPGISEDVGVGIGCALRLTYQLPKGSDDHEGGHTGNILWYTDSYFESQACLNEAGAIWAMNKRYQEILSPTMKSGLIGGLLDKQLVWFRSNDKYRLNTFKEQLEFLFDLPPLSLNAWENTRDSFINQIETITGGANHAHP